MGNDNARLTRKDFLRLSATTIAGAALAGAGTGCSTLRGMRPPSMDFGKGMFLKNASLVDVRRGAVSRGMSITILDGKIVRIDNAKTPPSPEFGVIDLENRHVIPGLRTSSPSISPTPTTLIVRATRSSTGRSSS